MKFIKLFLYISILSFALKGSAQIDVIQNSFGNIADNNKVGTKNDIGVTNMTEKMIDDWKYDADGEDVNAILVVFFENMSAEDMKAIAITKLSNEKYVSYSDPELHDMSGQLARWFYIPASSQPFDITFSHPRYEAARLSGITMDKHNIYRTVINAKGMVSININSIPTGATVYFDNKNAGTTPITIPDILMGQHTIELLSPDVSLADNMRKTPIEVSATTANFSFNLMKRRAITLEAKPEKAELILEKDGKLIAKGSGNFTLENIEYGTYKVSGYINGERNETTIEVNANTPTPTIIEVIPSRSISFTAIRNNLPITGADINIDGQYIGSTPLTKNINFGSYNVDMTYQGQVKRGKLKVGKYSDGRFELVLPNRYRSRHNPFDIDYTRREWGFAVNYINRTYDFKVNGQKTGYKFWGEEGHEHGLQAGIAYQPYFGYGQGLNTGLYWQLFMGDLDETDATYTEHTLYIPVQYQFRLPLSSRFSLFLNAGISMNIGLSHSVKFNDSDETIDVGYGHNEEYDLYFPRAFNLAWLYGGGIQFGCVQIEAKIQRGITDNKEMYVSDGSEKTSFKLNSWSIGASFMF